ncbi:MAG: hypothetical protein RLY31_654 [Bacteroidota bacterium]
MKKRTPFLLLVSMLVAAAGTSGQTDRTVIGCQQDTVWLAGLSALFHSEAEGVPPTALFGQPWNADFRLLSAGLDSQAAGGMQGWGESSVWLRTRLENRFLQGVGTTDWLLESDSRGIRTIAVIRDEDGAVLQRWAAAGRSLPRTGRRAESGLPGDIRLQLPAGEPVTVLLQAEGWGWQNRLWLRPAPGHRQWGDIRFVWTNWLSIGLIATFIVYNLLFFAGSSGRIFMYQAFFQAGVLLYLLSAYGVMNDLGGKVAHPVLLAVVLYAGMALADMGFVLFFRQVVPGIGNVADRLVRIRFGLFLGTLLLLLAGYGLVADRILAVFAVLYYGFIGLRTWRSPVPFHRQGWWYAGIFLIFSGMLLSGWAAWVGVALPIWVTEAGILLQLGFFSAGMVAFIKRALEKRESVVPPGKEEAWGVMVLNDACMELKKPLTLLNGIIHGRKGQPVEEPLPVEKQIAMGDLVRQLTRQVNHMERLARMSTASFDPNPRREEFLLFLQQITASLGAHTLQRNGLLLLQSPEPEIWMDFDREAWHEVMTYLLSQAILTAPDGERLTLEVALQGTDTGRSVAVRLRGTPADSRAAALRTLLDTSADKAAGRRWPTRWVANMVRQLGGTFHYRPDNEPGTVFLLTVPHTEAVLPANDDARAESGSGFLVAEPEGPAYGGKGKEPAPKLLVVENDRAVAAYLENLLQADFRTEVLYSAQEAMDYAREVIPDIILTEAVLPDDNGLTLCRRLKKDPATSHIPVLVSSVLGTPRDKIESLGCGADVYLSKPFHPMELQLYLSNLLRNRNRRQALLQDETQSAGEGKRLVADLSYKREKVFLDKIRKVVEENMEDEQFGIPQLCQQLNMSRSQLHRKLKALTGGSTSQLINEVRMSHARRLLIETDLNITEVAYQVGVAPNYFSRAFKAFAGIAPKDFRRQPALHNETVKVLDNK